MNKIIWIASYPKSGNTYVRSFLSHYLFENNLNLNFDVLKKIPKFEQSKIFERIIDKNLLNDELSYIKHSLNVQEGLIKKYNQDELIFKTHHFFGELNNYTFTNKENTLGFIHIIRDPRSVAISYAHHRNISYEKSVEIITDENNVVIDKDKVLTLMSSWKTNYLSWLKSPYPRIIIKYEDLHKDTFINFKKILFFVNKFKKIEINENKIYKSIEKCSFNNLKREEENFGFSEREGNDNFFRNGLVDEWKSKLSANSIKLIEDKFKREMIELNYL